MKPYRNVFTIAGLTATLALVPAVASATFPERPVRLIVPFPAGGPTDMLARLLAKSLAETFGQAVVVDNRGGAGGTIGAEAVARAAPDGYTLLLGSTTTIAVSPRIYKVPYDIEKSFTPVALFSSSPLTLVVSAKSGFRTVQDLVDHAKASPGKTFYGSPGVGTQAQLAAVMFMNKTGIQATHVPYKGGAPALVGLLGGEVQFMFDIIQTSIPLVKSDRATVLGVAAAQRNPNLPDTPTMAEAGLPDFQPMSWLGVLAPAGTPPEIVEKLDKAIGQAVRSEHVRAQLTELGTAASYLPRDEFAALMKQEIAVWGKLADANQPSETP